MTFGREPHRVGETTFATLYANSNNMTGRADSVVAFKLYAAQSLLDTCRGRLEPASSLQIVHAATVLAGAQQSGLDVAAYGVHERGWPGNYLSYDLGARQSPQAWVNCSAGIDVLKRCFAPLIEVVATVFDTDPVATTFDRAVWATESLAPLHGLWFDLRPITPACYAPVM